MLVCVVVRMLPEPLSELTNKLRGQGALAPQVSERVPSLIYDEWNSQ